MKKILFWVLTACVACSAVAANIQFYLAVKGLNLQQTNIASPVIVTNESPYEFLAEVMATDTNNVTNASVKLPSKKLLMLTNVADAESAADLVTQTNFISKKLLDAAFAAGAYTFAILTPNGSNSATLKLPKDAYPSVPHIANWSDLQEIESELPCSIRWDAITNVGSGDFVLLDVEDTNGATIFSTPGFFQAGALNGTNASALIPAEALNPNSAYLAQLLVIKTGVRNTNAIGGVTGIGGYFDQTEFPLVTLPEPDSGGRVQFSSQNYSASKTDSNAVITVTRVGDESNTVSVDLTTSNGTALDGTNYLGVDMALTFAPGVTSTNIEIPILNDFKLTGSRTVNLTLNNLTGNAFFGSRSNAVLTIADSQKAGAGTLQFSPVSYTVAEATATVSLTVKRTGGTTGAAGVNFHTLNGTAMAGVDYVATNGTLIFPAGKSSLTIPVHINNNLNETNPVFYVALDASSGGAALGTNFLAQVTIVDNDSGGVVVLATTGYLTNESAGFFYVTVSRTGKGALASNASVDFTTTNGSALAGVDYAATNGTLTFGTKQSARRIAIPILANTNADGYQNFSFQIYNPQGGATIGTNRLDTFIIQRNTPCIVISNATYSVSEAATNAIINLVRFGSLLTPASVDFMTVDGSAISPANYRGTNGTANFPANVSTVKIAIPIVNSTTVQPDRSFNFIITNAVGGTPLGNVTNATVTILNDEFPGTIQFGATAFSAEEGSNAIVKITRTGGLASGVTVQFTMANGTAAAGTDYSNATQTVTFNAGVTNLSIGVPLYLNPLNTTARTVFLNLSSPTSGAALGANTNATLNILNNPAANAVPLNGPLFMKGTVGNAVFVVPVNYCTASSNPNLTFQLNAIWNTGTVNMPYQNLLTINIFPRVLGSLEFNDFSASCSAGFQFLPLTNPNAARTWSAGGQNVLTGGSYGIFTLDAIDYTQKLASGRFTIYMQETTGNVSGGGLNVTGSFRVSLTP